MDTHPEVGDRDPRGPQVLLFACPEDCRGIDVARMPLPQELLFICWKEPLSGSRRTCLEMAHDFRVARLRGLPRRLGTGWHRGPIRKTPPTSLPVAVAWRAMSTAM